MGIHGVLLLTLGWWSHFPPCSSGDNPKQCLLHHMVFQDRKWIPKDCHSDTSGKLPASLFHTCLHLALLLLSPATSTLPKPTQVILVICTPSQRRDWLSTCIHSSPYYPECGIVPLCLLSRLPHVSLSNILPITTSCTHPLHIYTN